MSWPDLKRLTLQLQGFYYLATGLWPLLHRRSFVAVVGPKPDVFQLQATAALIAVNGAVIFVGARSRESGSLPVALGLGTAAALASAEMAHLPRLRRIFVVELLVELGMIAVLALSSLIPIVRERALYSERQIDCLVARRLMMFYE